ncbi:hypothetical protein BB560_003593 [Smittium megazygosporum]|uniref:Uncharacterized protein n=1 Tax=Smittium megazygosporum TaxID=133381 RepID=A0A2T9ZBM1_9FUNG|nr:hypothetical protein BB560_003593 [Smittium megazygosporum]
MSSFMTFVFYRFLFFFFFYDFSRFTRFVAAQVSATVVSGIPAVSNSNPYGIKIAYDVSYVSGSDKTVQVQVKRMDSGLQSEGVSWSYMFMFGSNLKIVSVKDGWSYAEYSNKTLAFVPPFTTDPGTGAQIVNNLATLEFTVQSLASGSTNSNDKTAFAIPSSIFITNSRDLNGKLLGFQLQDSSDYQVVTNPDLILDGFNEYAKSKYIPNDPNYDPNVNQLGTRLVGPLISMYVYIAISTIGLIAYTYGTFIRLSFRKQYYRSAHYI